MKLALFSSALLAAGIASAAAPVDGWYTSVFGGYAHISSNINTTRFGSFSTDLDYNNGYNIGGRVGYQSNPIRYEFEYTYVTAEVNRFRVNEVNQFGVTGSSTANVLMANLYYDFRQILPTINPYVGVGIGYSLMQKSFTTNGPLAIGHFSADRNAFTYQGMVGLTYNFSENYALNAGYRYLATTSSNGNRTSNDDFGRSFQAHMGSVGIIYRFDNCNYK